MKLTGFMLVSFFAFMACQNKVTQASNTIEVSDDFSSVTINIQHSIPEDQYTQKFQVFILNGDSIRPDQSPVIGNYLLKDSQLIFSPSYPFLKGKTYLVRYAREKSIHRKEFNIPSTNLEASTRVTQVYPSSELLPLNLLKLYIEFNEPMAAGFAYKNISIINSRKDTLKDAFLELEEELWSTDMKRLTILFDPGRIKQGLESFNELGYTFKEGETYKLIINPKWPDENNNTLVQGYSKVFTISTPITSKAGKYRIVTIPNKGSNTALKLKFDKSHDYALLLRTIRILNPNGQVIEGEITISETETVWHLKPHKPWTSGAYTIRIENILEDVSGNNLLNSFDVDNRQSMTDFSNQKYSTSQFRIN